VQAQLLEQMREEQAAQIRSNRIRTFVLVPLVLALTVAGIAMMFSNDRTTSTLGGLFASSIGWLVWKLRKRIAARFD
jgi:hypothetical protein